MATESFTHRKANPISLVETIEAQGKRYRVALLRFGVIDFMVH